VDELDEDVPMPRWLTVLFALAVVAVLLWSLTLRGDGSGWTPALNPSGPTEPADQSVVVGPF
jgi:hypothetical protein